MNYPDSLADCRIGFMCAGKAAEDLATGFIKSGTISAQQICASAPSDQELNKFKELDCITTNDYNNIFSHLSETEDKNCFKIIFFRLEYGSRSSISSQKTFTLDIEKLIANSGPILFISLRPGIPLWKVVNALIGDKSREEVKQKVRFARLASNSATAVCEGICALSLKHRFSEDEQPLKNFLTKLLSPIGLCEFAEDSVFYGLSILCGTGIAIAYEMIQSLSDGGVKIGIPRCVSAKITAQTVLGAALMIQKTEKNPIVLRDEVTEPKSATAHGLHALKKVSFSGIIIDAIECANNRRRYWKRNVDCPAESSDSE